LSNNRKWAHLVIAMALLLSAACTRRIDEDRLSQYRNLGTAFYENPTTHQEAVQEFQQALQLAPDSAPEKLNCALALLRAGREEEAVSRLQEVQRQYPSLPHTWFNLGIYYKRRGDVPRAIAQFEGMIVRTPQEPIAHYQLGTLYREIKRNAEAQAEFERAAALNPLLAAARFQLYDLNRVAGNAEPAKRYLADFQRIQQGQKGSVIPEDVEWCAYAEIYNPQESLVEAAAAPEPTFTDRRLDGSVDPKTAGMTLIDLAGAGRTDLLVWSSQGIQVFRSGQQIAEGIGLDLLTGILDVAPGDFDNDGLMDLCVLTAAGPMLYRNTGGKFVRQQAPLPSRRFDKAVWLDYDHDYDLDLVLLGEQPALIRNQGIAGWADRTGDFPFVKGAVTNAEKLRIVPDSKAFDLAGFYRDRMPVLYRDQLGGRYTMEVFPGKPPELTRTQVDADFDGDGRMDRARIDADGSIHLLLNTSENNRRWIGIRLKGVRSLKLAQDAVVEIKAGTLYRRQFYAGVPLLFDAGNHAIVDAVRITWPNGLVQNEIRQVTNQAHAYVEAQRLSGSCPMIWTWNGHEFEFITDVLGVAPLGASNGDGSYFPVDHVEYVQIPGAAIQTDWNHAGRYEVRITEELSEVSYLDQVQLYAVDHRAGTEIFTNEKFKGPPYPEFRLFEVEQRIYPLAARDDQGADVLPQLIVKDQRYPDQFRRSETAVADLHTLELDFGRAAPSGKAVLLLNGWVDWPDGSTFRKASQESAAGLVLPSLQMQDASGRWKTVNRDMGMPAGKPKTIVVPVEFLTASRKIRIVTNLCVYWDEIFLSEGTSNASALPKLMPLVSADLHFRGFSKSRIDPRRKQPDTFLYGQVSPTSFWNPTPGMYTKFGSVESLLRDVDDRLVIMGSGDEVRLQFDAGTLDKPRTGWRRDFLLKVDGWAKDRDPNTAFSSNVNPLPFHGMSRYPYSAKEHFPDDALHGEYRRTYNTRPSLVLIRPLEAR
jgi:tetratricopeptide (TPR) repeat protein